MKKLVKFIFVLSIVLTFNACSTIMTGTTQDVTVNANKISAGVWVDGNYRGQTPLVLEGLSTKKDHTIRIEAPGYPPITEKLVRRPSGWVLGNLVFGGIPGLVIDFVSGGLYVFEKDNINGNF